MVHFLARSTEARSELKGCQLTAVMAALREKREKPPDLEVKKWIGVKISKQSKKKKLSKKKRRNFFQDLRVLFESGFNLTVYIPHIDIAICSAGGHFGGVRTETDACPVTANFKVVMTECGDHLVAP